MRNSFKIAFLSVVSSLFSLSIQAQETNFSYTQLSVSAVHTEYDDDIYLVSGPRSYDVYSDIGGAKVSGSYQFSNNVIIGANGSYQENSGSVTELNLSQSLWFVGYAFPVADSIDFTFSGGLAYAEAEACQYRFGCYSVDENGINISGGVRAWASSWLELNAGVSHTDFDDFDSQTVLNVGAAGWFNESSSIFVDLGFEDDTSSTALGYRYSF